MLFSRVEFSAKIIKMDRSGHSFSPAIQLCFQFTKFSKKSKVKRKGFRWFFMCCFLLIGTGLSAQHFALSIDSLIKQITVNSYRAHFDSLMTGPSNSRKVLPIWEQSDDHDACRDYVFRYFQQALGSGNSYLHQFNSGDFRGLANVIGVKHGTNPDAGIWVVSAHYDTNNNKEALRVSQVLAPGANDNGTGVAALLEMVRLLAKLETEATIIFAAWDFEEVFTNGFPTGSNAWFKEYAGKRKNTDWTALGSGGEIQLNDLRGNINLDMFGNPQDSLNGKPLLLACYAKKQHQHFAASYAETLGKYVPDIAIEAVGPMIWSDHYTFAANNIPALVNLESGYNSDPFYHTHADHVNNPDNVDFEFASAVSRGALAYLLEQVLLEKSTIPSMLSGTSSLPMAEGPGAYHFLLPAANIPVQLFNQYGQKMHVHVQDQYLSFQPAASGWYCLVFFKGGKLMTHVSYLHKKEGAFATLPAKR
jgi:hypothetical protein